MRLVPRSWHTETWVCSMRGHCTPAATVEHLRPDVDERLGVDIDDGRRLSRCLRCDVWIEGLPPGPGVVTSEVVPELRELALPRRGKPLQEAILLRIIAIDRAAHAVVFGLLAAGLIVLDTNLPNLQDSARSLIQRLTGVADQTGPDASRDWVSRQLERVLDFDKHTITVLAVTAIAYCVLEGVEAVGLWRERRWAEYLTVVATAGFLPLEVHELIKRVTVVRVGALVVNVAIVVYLLWSKRLFGIGGGPTALHEAIDWDEVLAGPRPNPHAGPRSGPQVQVEAQPRSGQRRR